MYFFTDKCSLLVLHDGPSVDPDDGVAVASMAYRITRGVLFSAGMIQAVLVVCAHFIELKWIALIFSGVLIGMVEALFRKRAYIMACANGNDEGLLAFIAPQNWFGVVQKAPTGTLCPHTLLIISPHADAHVKKMNLKECKLVVAQCSTTNPDKAGVQYECNYPSTARSVNDAGNIEIFKAIAQEQKRTGGFPRVRIVTTAECNEPGNMFGTELFKGELSILTDAQIYKVLSGAAKNLFARMSATSKYNQHAGKLILGVPPGGANYNGVRRVHIAASPPRFDCGPLLPAACRKYVEELKASLAEQGKIPLQDEQKFLHRLQQTQQWVADLTQEVPVIDVDGIPKLICSTDRDGNPIDIRDVFKKDVVKLVASFNRLAPAYDFVASRYVLLPSSEWVFAKWMLIASLLVLYN